MYQSFIIIAMLLGLSGAARAQSDYWQRQREQQYREQQRRQQQNHERQLREQRQRHEQQTRERQRQFEQQQRQNQQQYERQRQYQQQPSYRSYQQPSYRQNSYSGGSNSDVTFSDEEVEKMLSDTAYLKYLKKQSSDLRFRSAIYDYLTPQQREMMRKKLSEADSVSAKSAAKREVLTGNLIIRKGVTSIEAYAYHGNRLDSVTIPDGVVTIENGAFGNNQLVYVSIPGSVIRIGDYAFQQNRLTDITLPDGLKEIGAYAFGYNQIKSVVIPPGVTKIGTNPFGLNNDSPTRITIGSNVEVGKFFGLGIRAIAPFNEFYDSNGKKAGTYVYANGAWNME